jgi:hypothetical protein
MNAFGRQSLAEIFPDCRPTARTKGPPTQTNIYHLLEMPNDSTVHRSTMNTALLTWLIGTVLTLIAVVILMVAGIITPRIFGFLCLATMCASGVIYYRLLKNGIPNSSHAGARSKVSQRKRWYILVAGLLWIVLAFWLTRGGPWLPRIVGFSFVALLIFGNMMRRQG